MSGTPEPTDAGDPGDDYQIPPLTTDDRVLFLLHRFTEYLDAFEAKTGIHGGGPLTPKQARTLEHFREISNRAAYDDLQALLGRRGRGALRIELALQAIEQKGAP